MSTDKIKKALSAEEWAAGSLTEHMLHPDALFALWNHRLPDSDPRKITREKIRSLREWLHSEDYPGRTGTESDNAFLDALESYLPPEGT